MYLIIRYFIILFAVFYWHSASACVGENCIKANSWQLGIALGFGYKSNPLVDGDNIPLVILPDIAWYSERAYFDNGELGYQLSTNKHYAFETFIRLGQERAFFSFFHPSNIFANQGLSISQPLSPSSPDIPLDQEDDWLDEKLEYPTVQDVSINDIAKRKWAIHGGLRGHFYTKKAEWKGSIQQDISGVHQGYMLSLNYSYKWLLAKTQLKLQLGADWKSAKLIDYYYGIDERDNNNSLTYYEGKASLEPHISFNVMRPITQDWYFLTSLSIKKLPSAMTSSPIVKDDSIKRIFIGAAYRF